MASIRDLNHKISSLQNMKKVMSAMNMIASSKFSKLLLKQIALQKFALALEQIQDSLFMRISQTDTPIIKGNPDCEKVHIILFSADRGLCGSHNNSLFKSLKKLIRDNKLSQNDFDVTAIGSRGAKYCRKHDHVLYHTVDINDKTLQDGNILRIAQNTIQRFYDGEIGNVYIIYNLFVSALQQQCTVQKILPLQINKELQSQPFMEMTTDLSDKNLVNSAAPLLMFYQLKTALSNSYLSENSARMTAMNNASHNSQDLIDRYASIKNRARQTAITNELSEIVSGTEAMKQ